MIDHITTIVLPHNGEFRGGWKLKNIDAADNCPRKHILAESADGNFGILGESASIIAFGESLARAVRQQALINIALHPETDIEVVIQAGKETPDDSASPRT